VPQPRHQLVFAQPVHRQHLGEELAIELAVGPAERRVGVDRTADPLVGDFEAEPRGFLVDQAAVDQLAQQRVEDPELLACRWSIEYRIARAAVRARAARRAADRRRGCSARRTAAMTVSGECSE